MTRVAETAARSKPIAWEGILLDGHKGAAVEVPFDPSLEWGTVAQRVGPRRNGYPVEVLLKRVRFRSAIVPRMRRFFLLVDEDTMSRAKTGIGDAVRVTVWSARDSDEE